MVPGRRLQEGHWWCDPEQAGYAFILNPGVKAWCEENNARSVDKAYYVLRAADADNLYDTQWHANARGLRHASASLRGVPLF